MSNVIKDKYALGQSESKSIIKSAEEIRLDLNLRIDYKNKVGAIIEGTVKDVYNLPIKGALIKLMTEKYEPVVQTLTGEDGSYSLPKVPLNLKMKLYATAKGKILKDGLPIFIESVELITVNFVLEEDPSSKFGIISGHILDAVNKIPINEAMIYLFYKQADGNDIIRSFIYANEYGQFVFREVPLGQYLIRISFPKYKVVNTLVKITKNSEIISLDVFLEKKPSLHSAGVISGVIKDKNEEIIPNANVVLYKLEDEGMDIPVDFTKTNMEGMYYFYNIPKGKYNVKCTEMKLIDVDEPIIQQGNLSPAFYKFKISEASSDNSLKIKAIDGIFSANSNITILNGFVQGIGGINNASVEVTINAPIDGIYKMGIEYLSANGETKLKFNVNDNVFTSVLVLDVTNSWNALDSQIFYTMIKLKEGSNKIKFYNDLGDYGPNIGEIIFNLYSRINETHAKNGSLVGGTSVTNYPGSDFVKGIGGNKKGYVELSVTSSVRRTYDLEIEYVSTDNDGILQVDVNGIHTGVNYTLPKTINWNLEYAKKHTITINLEEGKNKIKFYNDTDLPSPWIGNLSYKAQFISGYTNATYGIPKGNVILSSNMVGGFGGISKAEISVGIETKVTGNYILFINCAANFTGGAPLSVEVNSIRTINFIVANTGNNTSKDSIVYTIQAKLFDGVNQVKFYNLSQKESAYVGDIRWILIEPFKVEESSVFGRLYNGAKLTWKGKAVGIGGSNKGLLKLLARLYSYGSYKVSFKYLTNNDGGAPINLYVNNQLIASNLLTQTAYNDINQTNLSTIVVDFDGTSDDVISFHNYTGVEKLDIGDISFEKIISFNNVLFADDVEPFDGAYMSENLILGIGETLGLITFTINVPQTGKYDLDIDYLAEDDNKYSNISVNWSDLPDRIKFEKTISMDIVDIKTKTITLELFEGNNIIKIYNKA